MQYNPYGEEYEEQIAFQYDQQRRRPHRDVQRLTNTTNAPLPNRQQRAAAQCQAEIEARQRNLRGNSRVPPDGLPRGRGRSHDDDYVTQQPPRSAVRYKPQDTPEVQVVHHKHDEPFIARSSLVHGLPQGTRHQQQVYSDEIDGDEQETEQPQPRPRPRKGHTRVRLHPLVWLGAGMIVMFFLWIALSYATTWGQTTLNDWHYSRPRTFQIDAVVGHNDSATNPSHFIAVNLNRHVLVIEVPGGDPSKARIYPITTLYGDGQDLTPVTLSFKDVNGKGLLDMEIHIQDQTLVMINENGSFRLLKAGEKVHL
jgi:hypothetical protein